MINVYNTLLKTLKHYLGLMRYKALDNPKVFKKLLYLVILLDMVEWSKYKGLTKETTILQSIINNFVISNCEFILQYDNTDIYRNVSLSQTLFTWAKLYDSNILYENDCIIRVELLPDGTLNIVDCDSVVKSDSDNTDPDNNPDNPNSSNTNPDNPGLGTDTDISNEYKITVEVNNPDHGIIIEPLSSPVFLKKGGTVLVKTESVGDSVFNGWYIGNILFSTTKSFIYKHNVTNDVVITASYTQL